jgi:photosystem II stability/assembly factor-like uncharacterized protein
MALITQDVSLVAVASLNGEGCAKGCAEADECAFAVVSTLGNEGSPWFYVNQQGGQHSQWVGHGLTGWLTHDPTDIAGVKAFIIIVNGQEALPLARSQDYGATHAYLSGNTDMATHAPYAVDLLAPNHIVLVGADGYAWLSTDYGETWTTVEAGGATTEDLTKVVICRQNPSVIYAIGTSNAIIKSENGGYTWVALTGPSAGDDLIALEVLNQNDLLVGNDDGELWYSTDGGETWTMQAELPSTPANAKVTAISCCACGSVEKAGVCYLTMEDTGLATIEHVVYRNAGWGPAQWEIETGFDDLALVPEDVVCCDNNRALVVGGNGTNEGFTGLIS